MSVYDHTYIQEDAKLNYRNSCNEELNVMTRSQSKSQAKWPSLNIMKACPLSSCISKDRWWTLSQVPRNNTSHVFQDLGNAFVSISRLEVLKALGLIMRYLNPRKKRNRCSVIPIFPVALALQRKYFSQLENIPSLYIYKHLFLMCCRVFMEMSKNQTGWKEKTIIKLLYLSWNTIQQISLWGWGWGPGGHKNQSTNRCIVYALEASEVNQIQQK